MNRYLVKNLVMFFVGFCVYVTIETVFRGFSYWQMGVCGGLAVVILDKINDRISWDVDTTIQCLIGSALITGMELVIGLAVKLFGLPQMWDYSNMPLNYQGVICLPFSIVWFFLSLVAIWLADAINYYVFGELPVPYYKIFGQTFLRFPERDEIEKG
jgi:uncharacterized membrane protein